MSGQYFNCLTCDATQKRVQVISTILGANFTCNCDVGYYDNGVTACKEVCGDSRVITDQCDDGNTADNDGCSSTCYIENGFSCSNSPYTAPNTNPSTCYYTANMTITVARIEKDPLSNIAQFFLQVSPLVPALDKLTSSNIFTNISGASFYNVQLINGYLVCNVSYTTSIEGLPILIGLKPSATGLFSQFAPQNTTVEAKAQNGQRLDAYSY
jgi:cysteine-rich repeat protein